MKLFFIINFFVCITEGYFPLPLLTAQKQITNIDLPDGVLHDSVSIRFSFIKIHLQCHILALQTLSGCGPYHFIEICYITFFQLQTSVIPFSLILTIVFCKYYPLYQYHVGFEPRYHYFTYHIKLK